MVFARRDTQAQRRTREWALRRRRFRPRETQGLCRTNGTDARPNLQPNKHIRHHSYKQLLWRSKRVVPKQSAICAALVSSIGAQRRATGGST